MRGEDVKAQQRVDGDFERHTGQHGAGGRRRFAVRVGQPGVHRRQPGLGAVADEHEDKRQLISRGSNCSATVIRCDQLKLGSRSLPVLSNAAA